MKVNSLNGTRYFDNLLLFVGAGLIVVVIAFLSVGFQTMKAARVNPAKTLRSE